MIWRWLEVAGGVLFLASTAAVNTFVFLYWLRSHWRATPAGRATLGFMTVVAAIMDSAILFGTVWRDGDHPRLVLRVVLYGLLFCWLVRFIVVLLQAQHRDRAGRRRGEG